MTKISIITAVFNRRDTVAQSLDSIFSQTYQRKESIVIDGGSTDGTQKVLDKYRSSISGFVSEPDHGMYDAMNKGIEMSTGDIICFLNADDFYSHNRVLEGVAQIMVEKNLDALFGDVSFFNPQQPQKRVRRYRSANFCPERVGWGWMPAHPALFVRRDVFRKVGLFRTDYRIAGDFEWIARAFRPLSLHYWYHPEVLVHMRTGGISTGGWRNTLLLNREVMRACRENDIPTNWFKILSKYPAKIMEFIRT